MREPEQAGARSPLHGAAGHLMRPWRSHSSRNQPPCDSTRGKPSRRALQHRGGSVDEVTEKRREEFGGQNPEQHVLQWLPASGLRLITVCGRIRTGAYKPCTSGRCEGHRAIFRSLLATCLLWVRRGPPSLRAVRLQWDPKRKRPLAVGVAETLPVSPGKLTLGRELKLSRSGRFVA